MMLVDTKALANFVESSTRSGHTFIKHEFLSDKTRKCWLAMDPGFQFMQPTPLSFTLGASKRHVGMIRTGFWDEPAEARRCSDTLLQ